MIPPAIKRATIIGDGAMGTVCALLLADQGARVTLWGAFEQQIAAIDRDRENRRFLPGHPLPASVQVTSDPKAAFDGVDLIVSAVPCQYMRSVWSRLSDFKPAKVPVVSVTKGIEVDTLRTPAGIIEDCVGDVPLACLSGPCIAPELADHKPAGAVVASKDAALASQVQRGFSNAYFRVYTSEDVVGLEISGAAKNVVAIAAGICDGIGAGNNAKAALVTRGIAEISRLGAALGASQETFAGLGGVGDLITTCFSPVGRNRTAGERIGRGMTTEETIAATHSVIEGIPTTKSVLALAARHDVELPIMSAVSSVLFAGRSPQDAIDGLMTRRLGPE